MLKHYLLALLLAIGFRPALAAVFYVAPAGNDASSGTITAPFLTIQRAQTAVAAGDTVYIRGGTYLMQNSQIAAYVSPYAYITLLNKSGSATAGRINYWAYPGERPVFNYANVDPNITNPGAPFAGPYRLSAFEVTGAYLYIRGLEVVGVRVPLVASNVNTLSICFSQSGAGGNNIYERLSMHDGQAIGFYLTRGGNTLVLNCDAYRNNDNVNTTNTTGTAGGGNVDGFGNHPNNANYSGNVFRGCRAWQNSDDGYDCISAFAATTFDNCWAFYNGYTQNFVSRGDGNGFKAGGYGSTAFASLPAVIPSNNIRFCVSVRNKSNGFYSNHHLQGSTWYNNTAYQNGVNFDMLNRKARTATDYLTDVPGYNHTLRNNISLLARSANAATRDLADVDAAACTIDHNAFPLNGITATTSDFISLDTTLLRSPRQVDGSLPLIPTLRLAAGSSLIDAGIDVGFPYQGAAPDLGAYEFANFWTGTVSTDWFASANWSGGVPTATTDALIASSAPFQPLISSGAATARTLTIGSGATLTMTGGTLDAQGDWQNNGTFAASGGTVVLGTAAATSILGVRTRFWNLSVNANGGLLSTAAGASVQRVLTLNGTLGTQANPFVLESNSSGTALVVNNGAGAVLGNATVQRYIDPSLNPGPGYRHYSAPVRNTTVADLATPTFTPDVSQAAAYNNSPTPNAVTPFPTVFGYDQALVNRTTASANFDKGFVVPLSLATPLAVGRGYAVNISATELVDFVGTLTTGDVAVPLARNAAGTLNAADAGWQLLGNPYPAPLDYSRVDAADRTGLEAAMYVYSSTSQYAGQYRSYVNGLGNRVLPVGQGFFARVRADQTSGMLTFHNSQRLTAPDPTAFQRTTADLRPQVQLELRGSAGPADAFIAYAEAGATPLFDANYDATKLLNPTGLNLASLAGPDRLAIDGQAAFTVATTVLLSVGVPAAGTYSLSAATLDNLPTSLTAYLHDSQTGQIVPLTVGTPYAFSVTASQAAAAITGRFTLQFSPLTALATSAASLSAAEVVVYPNPTRERFTVLMPAVATATRVQAELLNTLGQVVRHQATALPPTGVTLTVETTGLASGVYMLRLQAGATTLVKRLTIQ